MELIYIIVAVFALNLFVIFIVKKKLLTQFVVIISFFLLMLVIPQYLVDYRVIKENPFDKVYSKTVKK